MADTISSAIKIPELPSAPSNPPAGYQAIYAKTNNKLYMRTSAGSEVELTNIAGGSGIYTGSGDIPNATVATIASTGTFTIDWNSGNPALHFDEPNQEIKLTEDTALSPTTLTLGVGYLEIDNGDLQFPGGGAILFYEPSGANFSSLKAGTQSVNVAYTFPLAAPSTNGDMLTSTTAGQMSWAAPLTLATVYPVGCIYISTVSTNPGTLFGFGTWTAFGAGRTLVSLDSGQTEFDTVEETGGAKTHTLTTAELPAHNHTITDPGHTHTQTTSATDGATTRADSSSGGTQYTDVANINSSTTGITVDNTGGGTAHNNLQPYIVVYMFKRTA